MTPSAIYEPQIHNTAGFKQSISTNLSSQEVPSQIKSSMAWTGSLFSNDAEYVYTLTDAELVEIDKALFLFKGLGLDGWEVNRANFPLPLLGCSLRSLAHELHNGRGFFVLRGLKPTNYCPEDNALIYVAISSHLADRKGRQNEDGDMFSHIREAKQMPASQYDRPVRDSKLGLTFHNDTFCDIIALQTLGFAANGGEHIISSGYSIYNELAATRPDLLNTLIKPDWSFDPRSPHYKSGQRSPIYCYEGRILFHFVREPLTGFDDKCHYKSLSMLSSKQVRGVKG